MILPANDTNQANKNLSLFAFIRVIRGQILFPNSGHDLFELGQRFFEFSSQNASAGVQDPVKFRFDRLQLSPAKPEAFAQQPFCAVAVVGLADSLFRCGYANAVAARACGQNENRHKTAFKTDTLFIDPQKIGAFRYPIFLRQAKT